MSKLTQTNHQYLIDHKILCNNLKYLYNIKFTSMSIPKISSKIFNAIIPKYTYIYNNNTIIPQTAPLLGNTVTQTKYTNSRSYFYDINSIYPFSLINKLPSPHNYSRSTKLIQLHKIFITPPNFIRHPYNIPTTKCMFSTTQEINYMTKLGYSYITLEKQSSSFSVNLTLDFILHLYPLKVSQPPLTKSLLNSLYGKLALLEKSTFSPLITRSMISYANILTHSIKSTPNNPSIYSDTDSFIVQHPLKLIKSNKLGQLKFAHKPLNFEFIDNIVINSPKNYQYSTYNNKFTTTKGTTTTNNLNNHFTRIIKINNTIVNSISILEIIYN